MKRRGESSASSLDKFCMASALATLTPDMNSHGVAIVNTFMQIAASVGSSLFGGIQSVRQASALANGAAETSAIAYGFSGTIMAAFVMGVIGIVLAIVYGRKGQREKQIVNKRM